MRIDSPMRKELLVVLALLGAANQAALSQAVIANNPTIMSQSYIIQPGYTGSGPHCFEIATLPPNNNGDDDHLHIVANLNYNWAAAANASIDALFGNRGGFTYSYTARGIPVASSAKLVAYMNADTSVNIYLVFSNVYATASYTVLETTDETVYSSPADLLGATPAGTLVFDSSSSTYPPSMFTGFNGNVGIGTTSPSRLLEVNGVIAPIDSSSRTYDGGIATEAGSQLIDFGMNDDNVNRFGGSYTSTIQGGLFRVDTRSGNPLFNWFGRAAGSTASVSQLMVISSSGNVGIGTTSPGAKLEINGNVKLTSGSGASITFADGTVQSTAYTGVTCGGDYAETVDVAGSRSSYEPGDVMALGKDSGSDVTKSSESYSTMVAGIYSTKPGVVGRRQTTDPKTSTTEIPMAMVGIVPTKVSAENGPIQRGDLLVSSSTPGYAMKGTDRSRMLGAVLGKAMGNLDSGTGVIEVLVTLQ